ncbi:MAG TPA: ISAzo13 family transposase [Gemmataceae bacterium]|nr:ISAzo13 family transposase [Gemmataceae bacterium]
MDAAAIERTRRKFQALTMAMDERMRRQWAAAEAMELAWGGISCVARATGLSRTTILAGIRELRMQGSSQALPNPGIRRPGGGRKLVLETDPGLWDALDALVDPVTRGHPESPLRWTCKSTRKLAEELTRQGHPVSDRTVARLLYDAGYSLQANRKTREGKNHPDRNAQFEHINEQVRRVQKRGLPVVSIDTKKKENVGDFKNPGQEWRPEDDPQKVRVHDFKDKELGKAIPHGVYDMTNNQGWVSVGINHDTAHFAGNSIRQWWERMGQQRFPRASELMITADGGGSNNYRSRLWKVALQNLANDLDFKLRVCHFPPGTSKWNKIEHRLFSYITSNWRGQPLVSLQAIVNLIASTTTKTGLIVQAAVDTNVYETGIKVSDEEMANLRLTPCEFHGEWNYTIAPQQRQT